MSINDIKHCRVAAAYLGAAAILAKSYDSPDTMADTGNGGRRQSQLYARMQKPLELLLYGGERFVPLPDILQKLKRCVVDPGF